MPRLNKLLSPRFLLKSFLFVTITYTIFVSTTTLFRQPTIKQYKKLLNQQIKHQFNQWYYNILASDYQLDTNKQFLKDVEVIREANLLSDDKNQLWDIKPDLNVPLSVELPEYLTHADSLKPIIQPFDPRLTLSVYYQYIEMNLQQQQQEENLKLPFHWSDWLDLSKLHKYIFNPVKYDLCSSMFNISGKAELIEGSKIFNISTYCEFKPNSVLGYNITHPSGAQTRPNRELLGKSYLYSAAPSPRKLIFLTNESSYQFEVQDYQVNNVNNSILYNDMIQEIANPSKVNVLDSYQSLVRSHPPSSSQNSDHQPLTSQTLHLPESLFSVDAPALVQELKQTPVEELSMMDRHFLETLEFSIGCFSPPKYFAEAKFLKKIKDHWMGEHYDWRFYNGLIIGKDEQAIVLHRLVKNYLNFARENGIITWIAHGSLLSWYWNGIAFPWDTDIDVQMPISELYKLGRYFNQSLVIENVGDSYNQFDGMGRYFIDVGSTITHRRKGNGNNNIDARFIDIDTGLYIDITGLALTTEPAPSRYDNFIEMDPFKKKFIMLNSKPNQLNHKVKNEQLKVYNCRNNHFSSYDELSPLVLTLVENQLSYIPSNFINILNDEYNMGSLSKKTYRGYTYLNNFRIWCKTSALSGFTRTTSKLINKHAKSEYELLKVNKLSIDDHLSLLTDNNIFKEWFKTMNFTNYHNLELKEIINKNFHKAGKLLDEYRKKYKLGNGLRPDYFINLIMFDNSRYDYLMQANDLVKLQKMYNNNNKKSQ
ncbi:MNN4 Protein MNN4 [Candida maltosa Xu316]|uniref:LicD/FKTN/FKRP nucleotidyltransferase domain-containing protein n=1 Tax=Candida maltosa (strain Xu316) TaxID=1245528 RepID=M3IWI5_CANMX|nr:hypothetical protein G210_4809 [Candida maltosa Xu316]